MIHVLPECNKHLGSTIQTAHLHEKLINLIPNSLNLARKLGVVAGNNGDGNSGPGETGGTAKSLARGNKDIGGVLVLTEKGKVKHDLNRLSVSSHDDERSLVLVQSLGS